jgi:hypothetical protein
MSDYPKTMNHPNYRKGKMTKLSNGDTQGEPDMLPPVTVNNSDQEAACRRAGYLAAGEASPPPPEYSEYPVMLVHPDHADAIPPEHVPTKTDAGVTIHIIPGTEEKFPPRAANNPAEEAEWGAKGYRRAGNPDPDAVRKAHSSPYNAGYKHEDFPKMVNGVVVDPNAPASGPIQYPKWVGDKIVYSVEEEEKLTGKRLRPVTSPCVICGEDVTDDDPAGEGAMGKFHLAHMAPANLGKVSEHNSIGVPTVGVTTDVIGPLPMTRGEKIRAGKARAKAAREAAKNQG